MGTRRVVLVVPQLAPVHGMERAALVLAEGLARTLDVHVVALRGADPGGAGSPYRFRSLGLGLGAGRVLGARGPVRSALHDVRPDHVVAVGLQAAVPTLAAAPRAAPVTVWEHSLMEPRLRAEPRLRMMSRAAGVLYPRAERVVAVSEPVAETVRRLTRGRVPVVVVPDPSGDPGAGAVPRQVRGPGLRLVGVGALSEGENFALAVEALPLLPEGSTLTLCGHGAQADRLRARATALGVADRVRLLGHQDDVRPHLLEADVLVHPSRAETFGLAVLEAAALARPVAVLRGAGLEPLVPTYAPGSVARGEGPGCFAHAVQEAAGFCGDAEAFRAAGAARASVLSPDAVLRRWTGLLGPPGPTWATGGTRATS